VSALPAPGPAASRAVPGSIAAAQWAQIQAAAPQAAETIGRYLQRLAAFLAPRSVTAAENALRQFARWLTADAGLDSIAAVRRDDIEDYKVWLAVQPRGGGQAITAETHRQRMRTIRQFFERIIEWDWPDAPPRNPVIAGDIPKKPEPLPRFLDDRDAAKLMAAARASTDPRDRLVVELLARTGMRAGELADLEADAVVQIGAGHWLRIPLGKLRNDRYVPLHPELTGPHAGAGQQLDDQPVAGIGAGPGGGHQPGGVAVVEELRQRLWLFGDVPGDDRVAGRRVGPVPLNDPLEELPHGAQPLPVRFG